MAYNETPTERPAMFNNHAVQTKIVNTKKNPETPDKSVLEYIGITPSQIDQIAKDVILYSAIAVTAVIVLFKVADTASQIAVKKTTAN
jgi:hypothetical protein